MSAITVTAAQSGTTFDGVLLQVKVLTGIAASPIGNTAVQTGAAAHQAPITITGAGSQVYAASATAGISAYVGNGNTTVLTDNADGPNGLETATGRTTSAASGAGSLSVGFSSPVVAGGLALLEILPSGTITEDSSSPAAVYSGSAAHAVTTAAFSPPAGSLLVAMVGSDSNTGMVLTVSDSSGLTWTQQAVSQAAGELYAGIWTARVPAAAGSGLLMASFP